MPTSAASVKKESKNRVRTAIPSLSRRGVNAGSSSAGWISPFIIRMNASTPTAVTSGSAKGSSMSGLGPLDAIARRAATAVAVAPTLDARAPLSPSNRLELEASAIGVPLCARRGEADDVAELGFLVLRERAAVVGEEVSPWPGGPVPAPIAQVLDDIAALAVEEQSRQVDVTPQIGPPLVECLGSFGHCAAGIVVAMVFGGELAAGGAQLGDVVEEPVLRVGREVHQQALGGPGRRLRRVKPAAAQGGGPVVPQVDGDGSPVGGRGGPQVGHRVGLELDDLGLIDLVDHAARRPGQAVGACVEAGREDHRLADTVPGRVEKEVIEEA